MSLVIGLIVAFGVAFALVSLYPDTTERWLRRLMLARKVIFGIGLFIFAVFLVATGASYLPFIGGALLVIIFVYLLVDPENELADLNPF